MAKKKIVLHFPEESIGKPITYHLVKDYGLIPNILRAKIDENEGTLVMDLEGPKEKIGEAIEFLKEQHVTVEEAIKDIVVDRVICVDCGSCVGVCRPGALSINVDDWTLLFDQEECNFCQLCIDTCPVRAIKLMF
ncbi:MAG: 4Fe-4S binding protein [Actinobacteria bacterium]|nr:4Fe-4S binding protein [Actinomycetota bacterium]